VVLVYVCSARDCVNELRIAMDISCAGQACLASHRSRQHCMGTSVGALEQLRLFESGLRIWNRPWLPPTAGREKRKFWGFGVLVLRRLSSSVDLDEEGQRSAGYWCKGAIAELDYAGNCSGDGEDVNCVGYVGDGRCGLVALARC
jgi:hypothetical protein